jgi:hypothetical protein
MHDKNAKLYADPNLAEGVDYARRHRRTSATTTA